MKVIYFDIDTLRPDHLSCCGYGRPTPHIDALAADGVRFSRAYASNTPCMPARAALFTGCFGVVNGVETTVRLHFPWPRRRNGPALYWPGRACTRRRFLRSGGILRHGFTMDFPM
ncbi:MAG: sulfatase-like hydrolase/transferase [Ruthenibacterium lactatiformans]